MTHVIINACKCVLVAIDCSGADECQSKIVFSWMRNMTTRRRLLIVMSLLTGVAWSLPADAEPSDSSALAAKRPSYIPMPGVDAEGTAAAALPIVVDLIPDPLREEYHLDPFYKKYTTILGIPIIGSEKVSDYAFLECAWTLDHLLHGRKMAHDALLKSKVRVGIIAVTEYTMDIPENQEPWMVARGAYNDRRSRGLGGLPLTTCAEENLLNLRGDHYIRENITIHEFSHTVASAIRHVNSAWYDRLRKAYADAKAKGIYGDSYAGTDEQEYWAEGAQCWFDCANAHNAGGASNRQELKAKDEPLAALLAEVYGDGDWRYVKTVDRPTDAESDVAHLAGLDRSKMPAFDINNSPRIQAAAKLAEQARKDGKSGESGSATTGPPPTNPESTPSGGPTDGK
jgi:hypothetical protein